MSKPEAINKVDLPRSLLLSVEKPARYAGGEVNMTIKNPDGLTRFAFAFPDTYEIGMSCLGMTIMHGFMNRRDDCFCERVFAPWTDMEAAMRERGIPLFSIETKTPVINFDLVGFTLQYELCYTNVLNMMDLAGIPLLAAERGDDYPVICAGGPCAYNPEPMADFIDLFCIGEGEACWDELLDLYRECKKAGKSKRVFLELAAEIDGIYVPSLYAVAYGQDGTISMFAPTNKYAPRRVMKAVAADLDGVWFPDRQIVPFIETVHDRVAVEVFRGCSRGCRFCQAGFVSRPIREKSPETLAAQADKLLGATGHHEISLLSLSTGDYSRFRELAELLLKQHCGDGVNVSLPSLRLDAFTLELMERAQGTRKSGLTFAPEAGSERLRAVINKNLSDDDILNGCSLAFGGGWDRVKLYFMTGLPTETDEDLSVAADLCSRIVGEYYKLPKESRPRAVSVSVSSACFVPKPFTPFQWEPQPSAAEFSRRQLLVKDAITNDRNCSKRVKFSYHSPNGSVAEALLARGDRRVGAVIANAFKAGAKFDGWSDMFKWELWRKAAEDANVDIAFYTERRRDYGEILPWDFIDIGVSRDYLKRESEKARSGEPTRDCRLGCNGCGIGARGETPQCFVGDTTIGGGGNVSV